MDLYSFDFFRHAYATLMQSESRDHSVKHKRQSPTGIQAKQKRIRVVKRLVERPKDKTLDFSELFKGYTVHKSRLAKRPYQSKLDQLIP